MPSVRPIRPARTSPSLAAKWHWQDRAACGAATPDEQKALTGGSGANGQAIQPAVNVARKYCDHCPVLNECYRWADSEPTFMGVAAGFLFGFTSGKHYRADGRRKVKL